MPYKEAIRVLNGIRDEGGWTNSAYNSLTLAIEALEKQIPRKPNFEREQTSPFGVDDVPYCPNCNCSVPWIETSVFYCESCGQAIDWSVSE